MKRRPGSPESSATALRIIGGRMRGSKLQYTGDSLTRPMKDRVREAVFNLLGPQIKGSHAIDLFAGTGALALEALSRGADHATAVERHFPTAKVITQNAKSLGVELQVDVVAGDTFVWAKKNPQLGSKPWTVFCCPPYALYDERLDDLIWLIHKFIEVAPVGSRLVVESDARLDWNVMQCPESWDVRSYPPAIVGLFKKVTESI